MFCLFGLKDNELDRRDQKYPHLKHVPIFSSAMVHYAAVLTAEQGDRRKIYYIF